MLLNPNNLTPCEDDPSATEMLEKTVAFFEAKGKAAVKADDHAGVWYADFLEFVGREQVFASVLTPSGYGRDGSRWDTYRNARLAEVLGFYGLGYWYTWQVSVLGLGPIWMSPNEEAKQRAARLLEEGEIFAFGLSEQHHGADVYSTDMCLKPDGSGGFIANGAKYYIGNANEARMISTFGRIEGTDDYAFFVADSKHEKFKLHGNVVNSQNYVASFELIDYPVAESDILHRGDDAWNAALNTVNIGKYNLGWASIGMCTHAFYEAITHAAGRNLYGMFVTDFPHVQRLFTDAYSRLSAMKMVALRAADYMRSASAEDRRYLLYNPVVKMKVTTQGEDVINHLWDVIAAKGFEKNTFFEMAARDIRALPKLEGTVHVNIALIVKFLGNYFTNHGEFPMVPTRDDAVNDDFLFNQGPTRGLSKIRFHDPMEIFSSFDSANVRVFREQIAAFQEFLVGSPPSAEQSKDIDFLLGLGEIFVVIVYAQLTLEYARLHEESEDLVEQIFDVFIRDLSGHALELHSKRSTTDSQMKACLALIRKPVVDEDRYARVWEGSVLPMAGRYEMKP